MTDFKAYKDKKTKENLIKHQQHKEDILTKELQLDLYETNTGKTKMEEHLDIAKAYHENRKLLGTENEALDLTAETLAADFDLL